MDEALIALIFGVIGVLTTIGTQWFTGITEHRKWFREQRRQSYSDALRTLARATIVPVGLDIDEIATWYETLADVKESLVRVCTYSKPSEREQIEEIRKDLFEVMDRNSFAYVATRARELEHELDDSNPNFVLWEVAEIIPMISKALRKVTEIASGAEVKGK